MKSLVFAALLAGTAMSLAAGPVSASDHVYDLSWGRKGNKNGEFLLPRSLAVAPNGNVYVSDEYDRVQIFGPNGTFMSVFGRSGSAEGQFDDAVDMAFDGSGNLFVADYRNHRVQKFDLQGGFILSWGGFGTGNGQFSGPIAVGTAPSGNVYVCDQDNHRVEYFDGNGGYLGQIGPHFADGQTDLFWPNSVLIDTEGNIYIGDSYNRIVKLDSGGNFIQQISLPGSRPGEIKNPIDIALDPESGNLFVADSRNHRIEEFMTDGTYIVSWGRKDAGGNPFPGQAVGEFNLPLDVCLNAAGEFYVADTNNNRVQKFSDVVVPVHPATWGRIKTMYTE